MFIFLIGYNGPPTGGFAATGKLYFPLPQNENTKINVPETENLAIALVGCYDDRRRRHESRQHEQLQYAIPMFTK
jgi:hypothetical protein